MESGGKGEAIFRDSALLLFFFVSVNALFNINDMYTATHSRWTVQYEQIQLTNIWEYSFSSIGTAVGCGCYHPQ